MDVSSQKDASEQGSLTQCGNRLSHPWVERLMSFTGDSDGQWCKPDSHHEMPCSVFLVLFHMLLSTGLCIPRNMYRQS